MVMKRTDTRPYVAVWQWLMALAVLGVAATALPVPRLLVIALIFGVAAFKALLVVRNYMHLRSEPLLILAMALVPVLLALGMALALVPDIVFRR